mgnify:CR=1 FL=1
MAITRKVTTSLSLPTEPNAPPTGLTDYNIMVYGRKQWGKSTMASQFPGTINFQFEPGRRGLSIYQVAPKTIGEAAEYLNLFLESDLARVVMDTVDRYYDMHLISKCKELSNGQKTHPSQFGNEGYAIWDVVKTSFEEIFETIIHAGKTFTLVSHDKKVQNKDRDGQEWTRIEPTCKPAAWKIGQSMCDFVFHVDFLSGDRIMSVRDLDNSTLASCNPEIDCFLDPEGNELRRFKVPNKKSEVYNTVLSAFNNEIFDADYSPPKKALEKKTLSRKPEAASV